MSKNRKFTFLSLFQLLIFLSYHESVANVPGSYKQREKMFPSLLNFWFQPTLQNISDVKPRRFLPSETNPRADHNGKMEASTSHQDKHRSFTALGCPSGTGLARGYAPIWPRPCLGRVWLLAWTDRSSLSWEVEEKPRSSLAWLYQKKN